jgi:hypothetical protein
MNKVMNYNPGVGLQMTSRRTFHEYDNNSNNSTPGPQAYDVQFKLTDREKRQNELISRRYANWAKKEKSSHNQNIDVAFGSDISDVLITGCGYHNSIEDIINKTLNEKQQVRAQGDTINGERSINVNKNMNMSTMKTNPGVGLQMTSRRITVHGMNGDNCNSLGAPYYDVQYKLSDREKKQNALLSRRYETRC